MWIAIAVIVYIGLMWLSYRAGRRRLWNSMRSCCGIYKPGTVCTLCNCPMLNETK